jgi:hypothetical protein
VATEELRDIMPNAAGPSRRVSVRVVPTVTAVIAAMVTAVAVPISGTVSVMAVHVATVLLTMQMGHRCLL